jgi:hypothetical protein
MEAVPTLFLDIDGFLLRETLEVEAFSKEVVEANC